MTEALNRARLRAMATIAGIMNQDLESELASDAAATEERG